MRIMVLVALFGFYFVSETWDQRSGNIEKQSHLLTPGELKKRGITRYDAELLLSQGIKLPEPRTLTRRTSKIVTNQIVTNQIVRRRKGRKNHMTRKNALGNNTTKVNVVKTVQKSKKTLRSCIQTNSTVTLRCLRSQDRKAFSKQTSKNMPLLSRELSQSISTTVIPVAEDVQRIKSEMPTLIKEGIKEEVSEGTFDNSEKRNLPSELSNVPSDSGSTLPSESSLADAVAPTPRTSEILSPVMACVKSVIKEERTSECTPWAADSLGVPDVPDTKQESLSIYDKHKRNLFDDNFSTHYDSELVEQQGWKVPKLTIRKRCLPKSSSASSLSNESTNGDNVTIGGNYTSSENYKVKRRKKKRHRNLHDDVCQSLTLQNGYLGPMKDEMCKGLSTNYFYSNTDEQQQGTVKRLRLKFGNNSIAINIPNCKNMV